MSEHGHEIPPAKITFLIDDEAVGALAELGLKLSETGGSEVKGTWEGFVSRIATRHGLVSEWQAPIEVDVTITKMAAKS